MSCPSRPPKRSDGSSAVRGGESSNVSAAGATTQIDCSASGELSPGFTGPTGEGREPDSPSQIGVKATLLSDSLSRFQMRSIFRGRRRSSGYFSYESDSLPDSPPSPRPMTADKATQTPSLTAQVMIHALERTAEAHGEGARAHRQHGGSSSHPFSTRTQNSAGVMQAESVGRGLRRIGDEYNRLLMERRLAGEHVIHPQQLPHIHQEPTILICMGLMLLLIGRLLYLQSSTSSHQGHSQV
ncbi:bcl-2-like protein 11 [Sphaeramia orbicularis]|uniref:bcl-2-like protein 11 n=1 Tax=Sphaeramia orbicularis TaxID=375764 RepID=UPI00117BEF01|nr:bcl-2-like protein 11 [Sphaeramia orbicularis]